MQLPGHQFIDASLTPDPLVIALRPWPPFVVSIGQDSRFSVDRAILHAGIKKALALVPRSHPSLSSCFCIRDFSNAHLAASHPSIASNGRFLAGTLLSSLGFVCLPLPSFHTTVECGRWQISAGARQALLLSPASWPSLASSIPLSVRSITQPNSQPLLSPFPLLLGVYRLSSPPLAPPNKSPTQ